MDSNLDILKINAYWVSTVWQALRIYCGKSDNSPYGRVKISGLLMFNADFDYRLSDPIIQISHRSDSHNSSTRWLSLFVVVQSLSRFWLFVTLWTAACQVSLSITNCRSLTKLMSIELVMPSNHLIFCHPLLLLPSIFPKIKVFSSEPVLQIRWSNIGV